MSLVTRCTVCATTFRVSPRQLSARAGRVRCGKCSTVFDGVASLLTQEAISMLPDEPSPQMGLFEARPPLVAPEGGSEIASAEIAIPLAQLPAPEPQPAAIHASTFATDSAPAANAPPSREAELHPKRKPTPAIEPMFLRARGRHAYALVWSLLSLVALAMLSVQAAIHFRTEIAVLKPQLRAQMEVACEMLGCELRLPRRAEFMSIESSDLQADTQRPGVIVLNALLRNRAPFEQEYPDLELTLTDERDQPVIRRVLRAGDYLQEKRGAVAGGIAAGAEEAIRIYLDTSRIRATGYRLFLFYR